MANVLLVQTYLENPGQVKHLENKTCDISSKVPIDVFILLYDFYTESFLVLFLEVA